MAKLGKKRKSHNKLTVDNQVLAAAAGQAPTAQKPGIGQPTFANVKRENANGRKSEFSSRYCPSVNENNMKVSISLKREPSIAAATHTENTEVLSNQANVGFNKHYHQPESNQRTMTLSSPGHGAGAPVAHIQSSKVAASLKGSESQRSQGRRPVVSINLDHAAASSAAKPNPSATLAFNSMSLPYSR